MVELIITIAIIAVIASAIYASIDPVRRLNQARNSRRTIDLTVILDGLKAYQADNDNLLRYCDDVNGCDPGVEEEWTYFFDDDEHTLQLIGENRGGTLSCVLRSATPTANQVQCLTVPEAFENIDPPTDLSVTDCFASLSADGVVLPALKPYIRSLPGDPSQSDEQAVDDTRYYVNFNAVTGEVTVGACDGESEDRGGSGEPNTISISR